jgi:hypothetical protein
MGGSLLVLVHWISDLLNILPIRKLKLLPAWDGSYYFTPIVDVPQNCEANLSAGIRNIERDEVIRR